MQLDLNDIFLINTFLFVCYVQHSFIQAAKSLTILNNMIQEALIIMEEESTREDNEVRSKPPWGVIRPSIISYSLPPPPPSSYMYKPPQIKTPLTK